MMARSDYQTSYETSPIILVGGVAGTGMLPLSNVTDAINYHYGITSPSSSTGSNFGHFRVLPGHTLMEMEIAHYPVANQAVAANAVITNPLRLSLEMLVPSTSDIPVSRKLSIMTALKGVLDSHTAQGGYYNVATPSYIYTGCLLTSLVDASTEEPGQQPQVRWIWNFEQPLLTEAQAVAAQNQAMTKISNQTQNAGDPPGSQTVASNVGDPSSNIVQNLVPSSSSAAGSNIAPMNLNGTNGISNVSPILPGS